VITKEIQLPFFAKASLFFIGLVALLAILYIAKGIIVPIVFSIIIAIVLHPVVNFLVRKRINRVVAIAITLFLTFIVIAAISMLIISQISRFSETWPMLVDKFTVLLNQSINDISGYLDINPKSIYEWIKKAESEVINSSTAAIGQTLVIIGGLVAVLLLVPTYVFLILYYQPLLIDFIHRLFGTSLQSKVTEIVTQTKTVIQQYLVGLFIEAIIVATLDTTALLILGIDYAILLGIIAALLNVIPYIGGLVAVALPMMVAVATKTTAWYALYVLGLYYIIQLFDNNFIVPYIVASKVKINALFSIIVVLVGNAIWGIPGMFISIPLLAIVKLILDRIDPLKPWGFLLGDTMPPLIQIKPIINKILK
jgi:predicted PurR-regulated permease PerM